MSQKVCGRKTAPPPASKRKGGEMGRPGRWGTPNGTVALRGPVPGHHCRCASALRSVIGATCPRRLPVLFCCAPRGGGDGWEYLSASNSIASHLHRHKLPVREGARTYVGVGCCHARTAVDAHPNPPPRDAVCLSVPGRWTDRQAKQRPTRFGSTSTACYVRRLDA